MSVDKKKIVAWFDSHKGKLTYSMFGSRNGADGTADCSGSVTQAVYEAGASNYVRLYSTVDLSTYLSANGFVRISANRDWDAATGDIVLMSWSADMSGSGGAGGRVGVMKDGTRFISCDYSTQGQANTAISEHVWNEYYNQTAPKYIEVWRYQGTPNPNPTPHPKPDNNTTAIERFKEAGGGYTAFGIFRLDKVDKPNNEFWQGMCDYLAGGSDGDWTNNGIPLACVTLTDKNGKPLVNQNEAKVGDYFKFDDGYKTGTIDEYDEATNGVGIIFGKYGIIWFNADALLKA